MPAPPALSRRAVLLALAAALPPVLTARGATAQAVFTEAGVALRGHDPVAYFTEGRPRRGDPALAADWGCARWLFATAANRDAFLAAPERYAPQYGGFCAWAVAQGYRAPIVPEAWRIVDGKLYLNASRSVQRRWERDIPGFIARADAVWPGLRGN